MSIYLPPFISSIKYLVTFSWLSINRMCDRCQARAAWVSPLEPDPGEELAYPRPAAGFGRLIRRPADGALSRPDVAEGALSGAR